MGQGRAGAVPPADRLHRTPDPPGIIIFSSQLSDAAPEFEIIAQAQVVEQILDRVLRRWRTEVSDEDNKRVNRWVQHREASQRVLVVLTRQAEVRANLGDGAPELSASAMHPWIWDGARSLWSSGHYYDAVGAAARKVDAEVQNKLGRRDLSEQSCSRTPSRPARPRRQSPGCASSRTTAASFKNLHRGAIALAEGWFAAVCNPVAHEHAEVTEAVTLEQLATLSLIARWADQATVATLRTRRLPSVSAGRGCSAVMRRRWSSRPRTSRPRSQGRLATARIRCTGLSCSRRPHRCCWSCTP